MKEITPHESDEGVESPVASTSKDSSQSYCEGKPTPERKEWMPWVRMIF